MITCPICSARDDPQVHHDHFIEEVVRIWRLVAKRDFRLGYGYVSRHEGSVVTVRRKRVAVGNVASCMRFAEPVSTCSACNELDQVIKSNGVGGRPRHPRLAEMRNFSLTPEEIRTCVVRLDGSRRDNRDPQVDARIRIILDGEDWAGRLGRCKEAVKAKLTETVERFPPGPANNPLTVYKA